MTSLAARRASTGGLRLPSGYIAQRKSLGLSGVLNIPQPTSPKKKAAQGRASEVDISEIDQNTVNFTRENVEPLPSLSHTRLPIEETNSFPSDEQGAPPLAMQQIVTFADIDATERWRNSVQPSSLMDEDEGVREHFSAYLVKRY
jgi:hypothetical protein